MAWRGTTTTPRVPLAGIIVKDPPRKIGADIDSAELRALQKPLKDAYRGDPEQAVVTLRARGQLDNAVSCSVETGRALAVAGLHPATGGDGNRRARARCC